MDTKLGNGDNEKPYTAEAIVVGKIWMDLYTEAASNPELSDVSPGNAEFAERIARAKTNGELSEDFPEEVPRVCPNCNYRFPVPGSGEPCDNCLWPLP